MAVLCRYQEGFWEKGTRNVRFFTSRSKTISCYSVLSPSLGKTHRFLGRRRTGTKENWVVILTGSEINFRWCAEKKKVTEAKLGSFT